MTPFEPIQPKPAPKPPQQPQPKAKKTPIKDPVLRALTREYFSLLRLEDKASNPQIQKDADTLQVIIKNYKQQNPSIHD